MESASEWIALKPKISAKNWRSEYDNEGVGADFTKLVKRGTSTVG